MKRILISLLACLLCFSMLVACRDNPAITTEPSTEATTGGNNEPVQKTLLLVENGASPYQIVISEDATDAEIDAAYELRLVIRLLTDVAIEIVEDTAPVSEYEIIVGAHTNRDEHYDAPDATYTNGYAIYIRENRIIIESESEYSIRVAVARFVKDCLGYDINSDDLYLGDTHTTLPCLGDYEIVMDGYVLFENALEASIVYNGDYMQKRYAYVLRDELTAKLGNSEDKTPVPALVTKTNETADMGNRIELIEDNTVESGKWKIEMADENRVVIKAKDYYGFVAAARVLSNMFQANKKFIEKSESEGDYRDTLASYEKGNAYAYNQLGEYRVMFYNALWDDNNISAERIVLNTVLIKEYMPDVLGLQEMNKAKRGNLKDGSGGLIAELAKLGYVEAVDPRVKNAYDKNQYIPGTDAFATTGANAGTELKGYGTSGATYVTYNGESYYTFFNCAPLLYNTKTTKLIDAGYYWYKNQWDKRPGQSHENWANDCGSKAATWGIFEDLTTGERYIAISTHMCTRSDYVKGLQAQEMVDLIATLTAEYDYPVILGGDYNGNYTSANFTCFEANGLVDVEKNNLATVYTSKEQSYHRPYPEMDKDKGCVQPTKDDDYGKMTSATSVDHIMLTNVKEGELDIYVFGVVIDECTLSGADHFPLIMDFSINQVG